MKRVAHAARDGAGVYRACDGNGVAYTFEQEHRGQSFFGIDRRVTSSSRLPGKAIVGVVDHSGGSKLIRCVKCGGFRRDLGGPHAPRFDGEGVMRDCVGELVHARAEAA